MECPDRKLLARFLDGEEVEDAEKLRCHVESCPRCGEAARRHARMGTALKSAFDTEAQSTVKESIPCPSVEELALYVEGNIPLYRKKQLLQHFCACPSCARAVLDAVRSSGGSPSPLPQSLVREAQGVYGGKIPRLTTGGQANPPPNKPADRSAQGGSASGGQIPNPKF